MRNLQMSVGVVILTEEILKGNFIFCPVNSENT